MKIAVMEEPLRGEKEEIYHSIGYLLIFLASGKIGLDFEFCS